MVVDGAIGVVFVDHLIGRRSSKREKHELG